MPNAIWKTIDASPAVKVPSWLTSPDLTQAGVKLGGGVGISDGTAVLGGVKVAVRVGLAVLVGVKLEVLVGVKVAVLVGVEV